MYVSPIVAGVASTKSSADENCSIPSSERRAAKFLIGSGQACGEAQQQREISLTPGPYSRTGRRIVNGTPAARTSASAASLERP